ncbi:uncharacterized protein LOC129583135 [Paramacrobiotus metropolitanus]|uniref:uncharacterized protein LOC129583135 n=1 Tax=Paramacrobiotus metropolitanus TaxID=2943436 RepID=UPI0024460FF8|nr:uncharacterized protein LOC129583135 [Paramacrobiotus metropolitanus]
MAKRMRYGQYQTDDFGNFIIPRTTQYRWRLRSRNDDVVDRVDQQVFVDSDPADAPADNLESDIARCDEETSLFAEAEESDIDDSECAEAESLPLSLKEQIHLLIQLRKWQKYHNTKQNLGADLEVVRSLFEDPGGLADCQFPPNLYYLDKMFGDAISHNITYYYFCPRHYCIVGSRKAGEKCNVDFPCDGITPKKQEPHVIPLCDLHQNCLLSMDLEELVRKFLSEHSAELQSVLGKRKRFRINSTDELNTGQFYRDKSFGDDVVTIMAHTDGFALTRSSKLKGYAVQFVFADFPGKKRFRSIVLQSLYIGTATKIPHRKIVLRPFLSQLYKLSTEGMLINLNGEDKRIRIVMTAVVADTMERLPLVGIGSIHAYVGGCTYCEATPVREENRQVYICATSLYAMPRTDSSIRSLAKELMDYPLHHRDAARKDANFTGICESSPLEMLPHFDLARGFPVDAMHNCCKGVAPQIFFACNVNKSGIAEINERGSALDFPSVVSRKFRSFDEVNLLTANEWRDILYTGIHLFRGVFTPTEYEVWCQYSSIVTRAFQDAISRTDTEIMEDEAYDFVRSAETVFGEDFMSYNVHLTLHLGQSCRDFGTAAGFSAFPFEGNIGCIEENIHGYNQVTREVANSLKLIKIAEDIAENLRRQPQDQFTPAILRILENNSSANLYSSVCNAAGCFLIGPAKTHTVIVGECYSAWEALRDYAAENQLCLENVSHSVHSKIILKGFVLSSAESIRDHFANALFYCRYGNFWRFRFAVHIGGSVVLLCEQSETAQQKIYNLNCTLPAHKLIRWKGEFAVLGAETFAGIALELPYDDHEELTIGAMLPRLLYYFD